MRTKKCNAFYLDESGFTRMDGAPSPVKRRWGLWVWACGVLLVLWAGCAKAPPTAGEEEPQGRERLADASVERPVEVVDAPVVDGGQGKEEGLTTELHEDGGSPEATEPKGDASPEPIPEESTGAEGAETVAEVPAEVQTDAPGRPIMPACPQVQPKAPPAALGLDGFYKQYVDAGGIAIVASQKMPASAFGQAYYTIANMLANRPCIRKALVLSKTRVALIGKEEKTTDIPEYSDLYKAFPGTDWNTRARGLGATLVRPVTSGAEENLVRDPQDRWRGELIFLHEFAHTIFNFGIRSLQGGPDAQATLLRLYQDARSKGLWNKTYAGSHHAEYWAEGVQDWFDNNLEANPPNNVHNHINTRAELYAYDPPLAAFLAKYFEVPRWTAYCNADGSGPTWQDPTPADPLAATCTLHVAFLKAQTCPATPPASPSSQTSASVIFVNQSFSETYTMEWIDTQGNAVARGTLNPRQQRTLSSFQGHHWRLKKSDGSCAGLYTLTHPDNRIIP